MRSERMPRALNKDQLVDWLEHVLQPVEPSRRFLRRLRARLVIYQGGGLSSGWLIVVVGGVVLVIMAISLGLVLRLLLGLLGLLGLGQNERRRQKKDAQPTTT